MPEFFFDYRDERGNVQHDTDGLDLADADAAYLEAYKAAIEIWAEARREGRDPGLGSFEIKNGSGVIVLEVPFAEALGSLATKQPGRAQAPARLGWNRDERFELTELDATIALAERHAADQRARLARMRLQGHDTQVAEQLLATLLQTRSLLQHRRDRLVGQVTQSSRFPLAKSR